jgi:pimeloyl-ACP methyl ester carboxylesterase
MTPTAKGSVSTDLDGTVALANIGAEAEYVASVYVHATGFCKEMWGPVVRQVDVATGARRSTAMLLDQRGHGDSTPFGGSLLWDLIARDVGAALVDVPHPILGVGHSGGAAAIARAEILSPGRFSTIVLVEPIVLPPPFERRDISLAVGAEKRRPTFASREAAKQRFSTGPFSAWDDEVLDLYVDHAFHHADGGWTLKCEPEVEAECFRQGSNVDTWDRLDEIDCRVVVITGENSDAIQDPHRSLLVERFRDAELVVLEGLGHLAPMEAPVLIGDVIAELIGDGAGRRSGGTID